MNDISLTLTDEQVKEFNFLSKELGIKRYDSLIEFVIHEKYKSLLLQEQWAKNPEMMPNIMTSIFGDKEHKS